MFLNGSFKVIEYGYKYKKDGKFEPISDWFSGVIHYSETGFMSVIMRFKQEPEKLKDIVAYCGSYKIVGDEIQHHVNMSARPEYDNETLVRKFKLIKDDTLELEFENTDEFRKYAIWKKLK
ncbi:MAG: lipocalin-like domain-containing protein [Pseudobdellovibrio sp.]